MMNYRLITAIALVASSVSGFVINDKSYNKPAVINSVVRFAVEDEAQKFQNSSGNDALQEAGEGVPTSAVRCPDCDLCDGSGRILGGIGTVLEWWPIKAYRPCPNFVERGGKYVRSGQGLDEIAFGRIQND